MATLIRREFIRGHVKPQILHQTTPACRWSGAHYHRSQYFCGRRSSGKQQRSTHIAQPAGYSNVQHTTNSVAVANHDDRTVPQPNEHTVSLTDADGSTAYHHAVSGGPATLGHQAV